MKLFTIVRTAPTNGHTNAKATKLSNDMTALNNALFRK